VAAVAEAAQLTETHRLAQARLGAVTVENLVKSFVLLDPSDIAGTSPRWLRAAMAIIGVRRSMSATLAANYLTLFRAIEADDLAPLLPVLAETVTAAQLATSLTVTGPVALRRALAHDLPLRTALDRAAAGSARAGMRHALNGGRETVLATVNEDPGALGYFRVTSGNPCAFCAALASRGAVYKTRASAARVGGRMGFEDRGDEDQGRGQRGRFSNRLGSGQTSTLRQRGTRAIGDRYHDNCSCTPEPIYRPDADWPAGSRQYADLWH